MHKYLIFFLFFSAFYVNAQQFLTNDDSDADSGGTSDGSEDWSFAGSYLEGNEADALDNETLFYQEIDVPGHPDLSLLLNELSPVQFNVIIAANLVNQWFDLYENQVDFDFDELNSLFIQLFQLIQHTVPSSLRQLHLQTITLLEEQLARNGCFENPLENAYIQESLFILNLFEELWEIHGQLLNLMSSLDDAWQGVILGEVNYNDQNFQVWLLNLMRNIRLHVRSLDENLSFMRNRLWAEFRNRDEFQLTDSFFNGLNGMVNNIEGGNPLFGVLARHRSIENLGEGPLLNGGLGVIFGQSAVF